MVKLCFLVSKYHIQNHQFSCNVGTEGMRTDKWSCTSVGYNQCYSAVKVFHNAGDGPVNPCDLGQMKVALDAKTSIGAPVGFSCFEVQQLSCVIKEPGYVDEGRAEARDQAHELSSALKQSC